ncbi:hypothetical protein T10_1567, partial [Trichinella papuae]
LHHFSDSAECMLFVSNDLLWFGSFCSTGTAQQARFVSILLNVSTTNKIVILLLLLLSLNGQCCVFHTFPVSLSRETAF